MESQVHVIINHDGNSIEFSGNYEEVWRSINRYFSEIYPSLSVAKRLKGAYDLDNLVNIIQDKVMIVDGRIVVTEKTDAKRRIALCLACARIGKLAGMLETEWLAPKQISSSTGIEERVTRARLSDMHKEGFVERSNEGRYRFAPRCMMLLE